MATFGSLFLTLEADRGAVAASISGHALAVTLGWLAGAMVFAVLPGIPAGPYGRGGEASGLTPLLAAA